MSEVTGYGFGGGFVLIATFKESLINFSFL